MKFISYFDQPRPQVGRTLLGFLLALAAAVMVLSAFLPSARAADPPKKMKPAVTKVQAEADAPTNPWNGFHIDAYAGMAASDTQVGGLVSLQSDGVMGALGLGYDIQLPGSPFVIRLMADYAWPDLGVAMGGAKVDINGEWTVAAGGGVALTSRALVYAIAGRTQTQGSSTVGLPSTFNGTMVGVGIESLIGPNIDIPAPDVGTNVDSEATSPALGAIAIDPNEYQLRLKASWRFDPLAQR